MIGQQSGVSLSLENVGTICGIVAFLLGLATLYLRLFISKQIGEMKTIIDQEAERTYARRETFDTRINDLERRLAMCEGRWAQFDTPRSNKK